MSLQNLNPKDYRIRVDKVKLFGDIKYIPHPKQKLLHESTARFRVLRCGRRWGKTKAAAYEAISAMLIPQQRGWIVAPTYDLAKKMFREVYWAFMKNPQLRQLVKRASNSINLMEIELINGSVCTGKSADNPVSLIGEGLNWLIIDEAARIKEEIWQESLRPTLADKQGWALFISTPRGLNWFNDLYIYGQEDKFGYMSWSFPSETNPYLPAEEIEEARLTTPFLVFQQEYMAEPVAAQDVYFNWEVIDDAIDNDIQEMNMKEHPRYEYYLGLDVARQGEDSSVFIIVEKRWDSETLRVVKIIEIRHKLTTEVINRAKLLDSDFQFKKVFVDETGLGAGVTDGLRAEIGHKVEGIVFTQQSKEDMYSNLRMLLEKKLLRYRKNEKLIYQLKDLRYEQKASSKHLSIHHSDNGHDDFTDALALSVYWMKMRPRYVPRII